MRVIEAFVRLDRARTSLGLGLAIVRDAAAEMTPRLELRALRSALAGPFDLVLAAGEALAVTGPSGAGKSVFLRMVADLDPNEGEALLDGVPRRSMSGPVWRARVGYAAAEPGWWHEQVGAHFADPLPELAREEAARLLLRPDIFDGPVRLCSTGERQRLALLRSLAIGPTVLLLDEPTAALDPASTAAVEDLLRERQGDGMALLLVTHDAAQAARLGNRVMRLREGRLYAA